MIPGFDLVSFAQNAGPIVALLVVAAIIFAESGLLIGFFLPGDSILFTVGILMQGSNTFSASLNIYLVIIILFCAAALGDNVGYEFGKKVGPRLFKRPNSLLFRQENIQKAQDFYNEHGRKTIIIARFIPIVRTFAPLIAGIAKMDHKIFFIYNLIGGALWTIGVTLMGYFLGAILTRMGIDVDTVLLPIIALILFASVVPAIYQLLKTKNQRRKVLNSIKNQFSKIFKKQK